MQRLEDVDYACWGYCWDSSCDACCCLLGGWTLRSRAYHVRRRIIDACARPHLVS